MCPFLCENSPQSPSFPTEPLAQPRAAPQRALHIHATAKEGARVVTKRVNYVSSCPFQAYAGKNLPPTSPLPPSLLSEVKSRRIIIHLPGIK